MSCMLPLLTLLFILNQNMIIVNGCEICKEDFVIVYRKTIYSIYRSYQDLHTYVLHICWISKHHSNQNEMYIYIYIYIYIYVRSSLVHVMACCLFGPKLLYETMLVYRLLDPWGQFLMEIQQFSFKKMHLKMSSAKFICLGLCVLMDTTFLLLRSRWTMPNTACVHCACCPIIKKIQRGS